MRTLLYPAVFLIVLWVLALAAAATARADAFPQQIYVSNVSATVSDAELQDALPAFQAATTFDFAPIWGMDATLILLAPGTKAPAGEWTVTVDNPGVQPYLGYHDIFGGLPVGFVYADDGWQVTFTHELFEILGDPFVDRAVRVQRRNYPFYYLETADPVEADKLAYTRPSATGKPVSISDFVTPAWFRAGSKGPWDFTRHVKRPLQILPEGYQIAWSRKAYTWVDLCYGNKLCSW